MPRKTAKRLEQVPEEEIEVETGSGNVFADLGLPDPELLLAKSRLLFALKMLLEKRQLTQAEAAKLLKIDQPKISALLRGQTRGYTLDRLFKFLVRLGCHIDLQVSEIVIEPRSPSIG